MCLQDTAPFSTVVKMQSRIGTFVGISHTIVPAHITDKKKQKFAWLSSSSYSADRAQNLPGPTLDNILRVLQISSKSVYFRRIYSERVNTTKSGRKVFPIFSFQPNKNLTILNHDSKYFATIQYHTHTDIEDCHLCRTSHIILNNAL